MSIDAATAPRIIAVIGTGTMGRGIIQVAASGGLDVIAFDEKAGAAAAAKAYIETILGGLVAKGRLAATEAKSTLARITIAADLAAVAPAEVVIEAIVERLDAKQALLAKLERIVAPGAILASNTSSIPITAMASACRHPERVAGLHFFNPVPVMKLVEVIPGLKTAPAATDALMKLAVRMTREPILCRDSPGFIVNHVGRGLLTEAPRILAERIAAPHEIDAILTGAPGFRIGMFALADLVGLDVSHGVMESFDKLFYGEPMFQPSPLTAQRVAAGLLGRKTGAGWYVYDGDKRVEPPLRATPPRSTLPFFVRDNTHMPSFRPALVELLAKGGVTIESGEKPSASAVQVLMQVGYDLTTAIYELKLDPARTVSVDLLFGLKGPRTLMVTPATAPEYRDAAHAALSPDGQPVIVIGDSPGYVAQRVVAQIINVACGIAQRGIASPADIDKGARLGLGYPYGPIEWGDRLGPARVLFILERLHAFYGDPRYRPSPWLKRRAQLGLPLGTPDGHR